MRSMTGYGKAEYKCDEYSLTVEIKTVNKEEVTVVTSLDVAETFEKRHDHVLRDVEKLKKDIRNFGEMFFETTMPDAYGRKQKAFLMNRDGFTLLVMGYTGEKAMKFKIAYIKQFNAMEQALIGKMKEREKGIAVRQALTKAIQQSNENERMHGHAYSTYTDIVYKVVFGKTAKQLREEYGITKKDNLRDYFNSDEISKVQSVEMIVSGLVNCGWGYDEIKGFIANTKNKLIPAYH